MNNKKDNYSQIKLLNHIDEKCDLCKKNAKASKTSKKSGDIFAKKFAPSPKNSSGNKNKNEINLYNIKFYLNIIKYIYNIIYF